MRAASLVLLLAAPAVAADKAPLTDPPRGAELPIRVAVSVWVANLSKIDEVEGTFAAEVDVRMRWQDARLAFDPTEHGQDRHEYAFDQAPARLAQIWSPQIAIANLDKGADDQTGLVIHSSGTAELLRRVNGRFKSRLDFSRFPFDSQSLTIELRSPRYNASQVVLTQESTDRQASGASHDLLIPNWHFDRSLTFAVSTRRGWTGRDHSTAVATLRAQRDTGQYFFQIFLPFITIMLFPPLALWMPKVEVAQRANLVFSGLFSLIALSYSIFVRYPMLAAVDNVIVTMLWLGYLFLATVLLMVMTVHNPAFVSRFLKDKFLWAEAQTYTTWSVPGLFVLGLAAVVLHSV